MKSTVDEIRARFDADVERFSNLEVGQAAAIDSPLMLELIAAAAQSVTPGGKRLLDIGCGAGNYSLKLLKRLPLEEITLVDLSLPMLERAQERIAAESSARLHPIQNDIRAVDLKPGTVDVVVAAAVLHHLRTDEEWREVFGRIHRWLSPGGSFWIADLVEHELPPVQAAMWERYGDYLAAQGGAAYREKVYAYVEQEDTPRSVVFQLEQMRAADFGKVEVLHKNSVFAAFGAVK